jgi:hypothetical protein
MNAYETTATVNEQGQVHLSGVPFGPGTEVEVTISPKSQPTPAVAAADDAAWIAARQRMRELFATTKGFRNTPRLPREELYDRGSLR